MLPVLDAFDLAAQHFSSAPSKRPRPLDQAQGLLLDATLEGGTGANRRVGVEFDPASTRRGRPHVEGDDGPLVDQVLRAGYPLEGLRSYVPQW